MTAPSSRVQLAVAAAAGALGTTVILSSVSDFVPDALEVPMLLGGAVIAAAILAGWARTRR